MKNIKSIKDVFQYVEDQGLDSITSKVSIKDRLGYLDRITFENLMVNSCLTKNEDDNFCRFSTNVFDYYFTMMVLHFYTNIIVEDEEDNISLNIEDYDNIKNLKIDTILINDDIEELRCYVLDAIYQELELVNGLSYMIANKIDVLLTKMPNKEDLLKINELAKDIDGLDNFQMIKDISEGLNKKNKK